jgi:ABC-type transport system involved in cytochrome c biogenesis permease subunit
VAQPLLAPPPTAEGKPEDWSNAGLALLQSVQQDQVHPAMKAYAAMATAYRQDRAEDFNRAVAEYRTWLSGHRDRELGKGQAEYYFNQAKPFLHAMVIYLCAFLLAGGALLTLSLAPALSESLRRSAFWLVMLAGLVHTFGLVFRMALEGRPPVTNLYSSAIFIGWGAMVLGIVLERSYRLGLGSAAGALAGFVTLIIAQNLAIGGDTMEMMRAVLDTNFWLATHVVVITLGYSANFFAGVLAIAYIVLGLMTPVLRAKAGRAEVGPALNSMVYAILCFATLFSFVGTVLGGIWADQSWGRFWGWDPKENGALIIVLWNAAVLHARWAGLVKERGLMAMAIFGNIVTSFSWFGVNMLGIGLHSYGFMDAAFNWLVIFIVSQLFVIGLALVPARLWSSFRVQAGTSSR